MDLDLDFSVPGTHYGRTILKQRKAWRRIGAFVWYRLLEPVVSVLLFFGMLMIGAAVLGAMFAFGAAGGLCLIGQLMFS